MADEKKQRQIVVPGEVIAEGDDYLPGENTEKRNGAVVALIYGLADEHNKLVRVIPLSGVYHPRRGNVIIGKVEEVTFNGWVVNMGAADNGFLTLMEVPKYVNKNALEEVLAIGDLVVAKIYEINKKGIDLSIKPRGLGKIDEGLIVRVNPNKVPRIIGKEGSMVNLIKENTGCNVTVGQNGFVWIKGDKIEDELFAKKAILYVCEKSFMSGLTDEITKWFKENKK